MNETKQCRRCLKTKHVSHFRQYYHREGLYAYCKECESVDNRRKYLKRKCALTELEVKELKRLDELVALQTKLGVRAKTKESINDIIDAQFKALEKHNGQI